MNRTYLIALGLLVAAFVGGCSQSTDGGKTLATVNGQAITEKDFETYKRMRQGQQPPIADPAKEKETVLNELIDRSLLTRHARELKLDKDPEVSTLLKRVEENILAQSLMRKILKDNPINDEQLKKQFTDELEKLHKNEYKVSHILVATEDEAKAVIGDLKKGAAFAKLAKDKSIDKESGKKGGELGWVRQDMVVPEFFTAVLALKKGAYSDAPAKSEFGWHVVQLQDSRALKMPGVDELMANPQAREQMSRRMRDERVNTLIKELRAKASIKME